MEVELLGETKVVPVSCKCKEAEYEAIKESEKTKDKIARLERLKKHSLMDSKFLECRFQNFKVDESNRLLLGFAEEYCLDWKNVKKEGLGVTFYGKPGVGKSYISFCIANYLMERMVPVVATSSVALINRIYESYGKYGEEGELEIVRSLNNADLLILDDLGAEHEGRTGKEKQIIYSILDSRSRSNKPTIITTNLSLEQLRAKLTGQDGVTRTYERLIEMCVPFEVKGVSKRVDEAKRKQNLVREMLKSASGRT